MGEAGGEAVLPCECGAGRLDLWVCVGVPVVSSCLCPCLCLRPCPCPRPNTHR